jgi:hypothetical protein
MAEVAATPVHRPSRIDATPEPREVAIRVITLDVISLGDLVW